MELNNEFTVDVPIEQAWELLTDIERIAPCMPGAVLESVEDGNYKGAVKVKVGPVTTQYRGTIHFLDRDETAHRAVLRAEGREARGQGNASATITATLTAAGTRTTVVVATDLIVTGRVAQFGRGVLAEVSGKLLQQFANSLEASLAIEPDSIPNKSAGDEVPPSDGQSGAPDSPDDERSPSPSASGPPGATTRPTAGSGPQAERSGVTPTVEPVDLLAVAGTSVVKRVGVVLGVLGTILTLAGLARRLARSSRKSARGARR